MSSAGRLLPGTYPAERVQLGGCGVCLLRQLPAARNPSAWLGLEHALGDSLGSSGGRPDPQLGPGKEIDVHCPCRSALGKIDPPVLFDLTRRSRGWIWGCRRQ